ncbi:MAG: NADH-ubiquinone oxidoreductase subunit NDUFA12 family protein [Alphaproteobacteria bacterium]
MSAFSNLLASLFKGEQVGADSLGNRYFREKNPRKRSGTLMREKRWVRYAGGIDGSKTPPLWNAWLHHNLDEVPTQDDFDAAPDWVKPHQENLSGTKAAYRPKGSIVAGGEREIAAGDYEPWTPS